MRVTATIRRLALLAATALAMVAFAAPAWAAPTTYTVDTTADTNLTACVDATPDDCSLRGAINASNANVGADTIEFEIPGAGVHTITPATNLPTINEAVTINGYSQTDARANTMAQGNNAVLLIELNGTNRSYGLSITAAGGGSTVRGLVINRVGGEGILVNSSDNVIAGNFIGTDAAGNTRLANGTGISIITGNNNLIGGTSPPARNVISGNGSLGNVFVGNLTRPTATTIRGNHIGTNAAGTAALINGTPSIGVYLNGANGVVIGGSDADDGATDGSVGARNVISATSVGVSINPSGGAGVNVDNVTIAGNFIGVDATGLTPLGNGTGGIQAITATSTDNLTIGGTAAGAGNIISGNYLGFQGGALRLTIQGNFVGTDLSGTRDLGNTTTGVHVSLGGNEGPDFQILVGGSTPAERNIISGNGIDGVWVTGVNSGSVAVRGNFIGTQSDGQTALPNGDNPNVAPRGNGVRMNRSTTVGGTAAGEGNVIAHNGGDGVSVDFFQRSHPILGNSIFSNEDLGIDLGNNGVSANDTLDPDVGPNNLQNFPVITSATASGGNATVSGTLNSTENTTFRIEFFANTDCNAGAPNDYGEGRTFIGSTNVTTNGGGDATFTSIPLDNVPAGQSVITSTATNTATNDTSEFSKCLAATVPADPLPVRDDQGSTGEAAAVGNSFISQYGAESTSPTRLNRLNTAQRPYTLDQIGNDIPSRVNAIGYRSTDHSLYGYRLTSPSGIVKIDPSSGATTFLGNPRGLPSAKYVVGDVSPNGSTYYLYASGSGVLRQVNLATMKVRSVKLSAKIKLADLAVSPLNNNLYGVATAGKLLQVNPRTGRVTPKKVAGLVGGTYGATWFTAEGDLIAYENGATRPNGTMTWITSPTTPTPRIVSSQAGPRTDGNDGAAYVAPPDPAGLSVVINVLANDGDASSTLDPNSLTIVQQPADGTATIGANQTITYTSGSTYNGTDSFRYEVCDTGTPRRCGTATVSITSEPVSSSAVARSR